jgi:predicted Zn finger-like uncharacterized protein
MIEIQCTSCHTRYRIDERVLPDDTPTFKCSRCGHVFTAEPVPGRARRSASAPRTRIAATAARREPARAPEAEPEARDEPQPAAEASGETETAAPIQAQPVAPPPPEPEGEQRMEDAHSQRPPTDELLNRPFSHDNESADPAENLSFDFSDDSATRADDAEDASAPAIDDDDDGWQVGEPAPEPDAAPPAPRVNHLIAEPAAPPRIEPAPVRVVRAPQRVTPPPQFSMPAARPLAADRDFIPDDVAYIEPRGSTHSSGWFLGLFFAIVLGFSVLTMGICGEPQASARALSQLPLIGAHFARPIVPAMLVALHEVHADYRPLKGGQTALVVSGTAQNVGSTPLHAVLIAVDLLDGAQHQIAAQAAWCGNNLSTRMIGEMTPREIEFLERLDPQKNFVLEQSHTAPFLLVFINPPPRIANLRISVAKAAPPDAAPHG